MALRVIPTDEVIRKLIGWHRSRCRRDHVAITNAWLVLAGGCGARKVSKDLRCHESETGLAPITPVGGHPACHSDYSSAGLLPLASLVATTIRASAIRTSGAGRGFVALAAKVA